MKKILALIVLLSASHMLFAQYRHSSGLRLGYTSAMTYKHFIKGEEAVEFMLSGRDDGFQLTTLYLEHKPLEVSFNENFYLYYGAGAHIGYEFMTDRRLILSPTVPGELEYETNREAFFTMGVNAMIGVEYRWLAVPITISLDFKPYLDFVGMRDVNLRFWDTAIAVKYVF